MGEKIVVTHHLPSNECNIDRFKNSELNQAFCVEKSRFISENNIRYWIYGHSHGNKEDFLKIKLLSYMFTGIES